MLCACSVWHDDCEPQRVRVALCTNDEFVRNHYRAYRVHEVHGVSDFQTEPLSFSGARSNATGGGDPPPKIRRQQNLVEDTMKFQQSHWLVVCMLWLGEGIASAQIDTSSSLSITISTGIDDLRCSSHLMIQTKRADGTWSSEKEVSEGFWCEGLWASCASCYDSKFASYSKCHVTLTNWDGIDPCATEIRLRVAQGSCFLATDDNWDLNWIQLDYTPYGGCGFTSAFKGSDRLTGSRPTVAFSTYPAPAGTTCRGGAKTADCSGHPIDTNVLRFDPPYHKDWVCDDGSSGFNFMCNEFLYDSGGCGVPANWPSACNGYYEDGECDCMDCGAIWDPDCNDPSINSPNRTVWGCGSGQICYMRKASCGASAQPTCDYPPPIIR